MPPEGHVMTAPMLTPLDSAIFDDDVVGEMEEHFHEDVACTIAGCGQEAAWRVTLVCCALSNVICSTHLENWASRVRAQTGQEAVCNKCHTAQVVSFDRYRVTEL
jgi:hypothetical protein